MMVLVTYQHSDYYREQARKNPKCDYFKQAEKICRGNNPLVNALTNTNISSNNGTVISTKQSDIYNNIRTNLIARDIAARANGSIDKNGCTCGDDIDRYHNDVFRNAGLSTLLYGGNLFPQDTNPLGLGNPVPYEPRGFDPIDDVANPIDRIMDVLN